MGPLRVRLYPHGSWLNIAEIEHGSWLNIAEIELNVMIRQCLNRRIDSFEVLRAEVAAWQAARDRIQAKVDWQFTTDDARIRLKRLYPTFDK